MVLVQSVDVICAAEPSVHGELGFPPHFVKRVFALKSGILAGKYQGIKDKNERDLQIIRGIEYRINGKRV